MTPLHHHSHHHGGPVPASVVHATHHLIHIPVHGGETVASLVILMLILAVLVAAWKVLPDGRRIGPSRHSFRRQPRQSQSRYSDGY